MLFLLLIGFSNSVYSQTATDTITKAKYVYCNISGVWANKFKITINYGQDKTFSPDTKLKEEESSKVASYNTMIDALNYMTSRGWEFVQAIVLPSQYSNDYQWLLKKKIF